MATRGCSVEGCEETPTFRCWECGERFCVVNEHARRCPLCGNHVCENDRKEHENRLGLCVSTFRLESHLQSLLRCYLQQLEPGLKINDGGKEQVVLAGKGRTDIEAIDAKGIRVVIELKVRNADHEAVKQILEYLEDETKDKGLGVRGILVAESFTPDAVTAAKAVPNLELRKYTCKFRFRRP